MKTRKIVILAVVSLFIASFAYGAEGRGMWQRFRDRFFPRKEAVKVAPKVSAAKAVPAKKAPEAAAPAPASAPAPAAEARVEPRKERSRMTKEELIAGIKDDLDSEEEILNYVPALKKSLDAEGKAVYLLDGVPLEQARKEGLEKISATVAQIATKIRTDRIQRQLEVIRRAGDVNRLTGAPRPPAAVPRAVMPVAPPPRPPQAVNIPRIPAVPPTTKR